MAYSVEKCRISSLNLKICLSMLRNEKTKRREKQPLQGRSTRRKLQWVLLSEWGKAGSVLYSPDVISTFIKNSFSDDIWDKLQLSGEGGATPCTAWILTCVFLFLTKSVKIRPYRIVRKDRRVETLQSVSHVSVLFVTLLLPRKYIMK